MKSSQKSACSPVVVMARLEEERHGFYQYRTIRRHLTSKNVTFSFFADFDNEIMVLGEIENCPSINEHL